jgi:hypothetical protein
LIQDKLEGRSRVAVGVARIGRLRAQGRTVREIAAELGRSRSLVLITRFEPPRPKLWRLVVGHRRGHRRLTGWRGSSEGLVHKKRESEFHNLACADVPAAKPGNVIDHKTAKCNTTTRALRWDLGVIPGAVKDDGSVASHTANLQRAKFLSR